MNKKINQLIDKTAVSTDLMLVGDPTTGTSYKSTLATLPLVPTSRTITINGVTFDLSQNRTWTISSGTVTSVGLTMPSAFSVANSPITSSGTLAVTANGTAAQYIRGDGQLATLPSGGGGGASVNYYLNGGTNQGTFGGSTYYEMNKSAIVGTGVDFSLAGNGLISQWITDAGDPNSILIPGGNWNFEMFFSASSSGGTPAYYVELVKYSGTTFTSIASNIGTPEGITGGTAIDVYLTSLAVPETILLSTDRLAIRIYIVNSVGGRTITNHTQDSHLCQITTTFASGVSALNGLTANTQYFATGTSGTDFAISSLTDTHTFNLPTASATKRGALSSADWTTFNGKQNTITLTTIGGGGASTLIGSTLNIPTYQQLLTNPVTGTGTINEITYWTSSYEVGSLNTTTYPSLTELSYAKGVTSSIQTQINNKFTLPALTSGSVLFSNGTTIAQDNANFFWDDTNNRLGIGTAFPTAIFHSVGTVNSASLIGRGAYFNNTVVATANNDVLVGLDITPTFTNGAFTGVRNAHIRLVSGANSTLIGMGVFDNTVANSDIVYSSAGALRFGALSFDGAAFQGFGGTSGSLSGQMYFDYGSFTRNLTNRKSIWRSMSIGTAPEVMTLTAAGRLLLGTTSESTYILDVNGTARVSGNATFGTIGAGTGMFWDSTNNNLGIGTNAGSATDSISIIGSSSARKSIVVQNTNSAGNTSFYFQNNRGSFASYGGLLHGGSTYSTTFFGVSSSDKTILLSDGANSTGLMIGTLVSANVIFGTNNSERARLTAAGRLLLGTTTEGTDLLLVNGSAKIIGNFTAIGLPKFETTAFPDFSTYIGDGTYANGIGFCYGLNASGEGAINIAGYLGGITHFRDLRIGNGKGADIAKFFASTGNLVLQNGGTLTDVASAQLQVSSTTKGFLPPRMTTTQKNAIATPAAGLQVYDSTLNQMSYYNGTTWINF